MGNETKCACSKAPKLIFACSGASDVGEITDRAARLMTKNGHGKMFCLAGIGGRLSGFIKTTEAAEDILCIDGCPLDCAKNCLEQAGFSGFKHLQLVKLGMFSGKTEVSEENIIKAAEKGAELLG